jgi:hypothetical protein
MINNNEKIISLVRQKGPCLPSDIYKELETNQLFASAMLGELVSSGLIKITNLKRSSSPYYYLEEQKEKLQDLSIFLNDKDKIAYELIKKEGVLQDLKQSALIRVALSKLQDFAFPLNITYNNKKEIFWKWYLLTNAQAEEKIKKILNIKEKKITEKENNQKPIKQTIQKQVQNKIKEKIIEKANELKEKNKKQEISTKFIDKSSPFLEQITKYFNKNNIKVISHEILNNKKTEIDFIIELPSSFGNLEYYCKAKNKKKINDTDIASAFVQGQQKKLPVIVLITGDMTKKSQLMLNKEFKGIKVHKV